MNTRKLSSFSKYSGCSCKIQTADLNEILKDLRQETKAGLLVGNLENDDASVHDLDDGNCLIQTVDFFTPLSDNAFQFGRIAAANALSDIYAMGGKPLMANALLGWPLEELGADMATEVLKGAAALCDQAGIVLSGGHSIVLTEAIFGLSCTGLVKTANLKRNSTAEAGDLIYLSKALGSGLLSNSLKKGKFDSATEQALYRFAGELNSQGSILGKFKGLSAMTDITGFGFYGHLYEMCQAAKLSAQVYFDQIPLIEEAKAAATAFLIPDATFRNWNQVEKKVLGSDGREFAFLNDPQTNGGLLFSIYANDEKAFDTFCLTENISFSKIGKFLDGDSSEIKILY